MEWTERVRTGGPGYDFSQTNIFWDRTDIYFDNAVISYIQRTKPTDLWTERTRPTEPTVYGFADRSCCIFQNTINFIWKDYMYVLWLERTSPTDSWAERPSSVASWTERTKAT